MEAIYKVISENPNYFAWVFSIVNLLWGVFLYFNKRSHEKALASLKHSLSLELERKKKIFGMKSESYDSYFKDIDAFFRRHHDDLEKVFAPIYKEFFAKYLGAEGFDEEQRNVLVWFNNEIGNLYIAGMKEFQALDQQTNSLQLTASEEVSKELEKLRDLYNQIFEISSNQMTSMTEILIDGNYVLKEQLDADLKRVGGYIKETQKNLREAMRRDLEII